MSLQQISLRDYDTVVAVTQNALNETLAEYLDKLEKEVALYYTTDSKGDLVPVKSKADAAYVFTGTLDYTVDEHGKPVDIVELYNPGKGDQTVRYNVTFKEAEFIVNTVPKLDVRQKPGEPPWIFEFDVYLALQDSRLDQLPPAIRQKVEEEVKNLGPDMFSIQQLYLDLNEAVFDTFQNLHGLTPIASAILGAILKAYLKEQQTEGGILFGYNLVYKDRTSRPPTFMPTDLNFNVTPYLDASGRASNPGLDTLNYLVMTGHRRPPAYPPKEFPFNWVSDPHNQGTMAVRTGLITPFIAEALSPILKSLCPKVHVEAKGSKSVYDQPMKLEAGESHDFEILSPPTGDEIARFSYESKDHAHTSGFGYSLDVSAHYWMECKVSLVPPSRSEPRNLIHLSGSIATKAEVDDSGLSSDSVEMPKTTYPWSVDLVLEIDLEKPGQLDFVVANPNFDTPPTVEKHHEKWWQRFLDGLSGQFKSYVKSMGDLRSDILTQIEGQILSELESTLRSMNHFVFPGGNTFAFKNPQFSDALDLTSNVTYFTPESEVEEQPDRTALPEEGSCSYLAPQADAPVPPTGGGTGLRRDGTPAKLHFSTELMKNQKAGSVLPPQSQFSALQTAGGDALFFSIGDDGAFYLTVERDGHESGWESIDLSGPLATEAGAAVEAKHFAVSQDPDSGEIAIAVAVASGGSEGDRLYVLTGLSDAADASWLSRDDERPWLRRPFDPTSHPAEPLDIAYTYLAEAAAGERAPALVVGVRREQSRYIQNYTVDTDPGVTSGIWKVFQTAENYDQLFSQRIGKPKDAMYEGLYQLYGLGGATSLVFVPMHSLFGPPTVTKLIPPDLASALAVIPTGEGTDTDLYVGAEGGIYLYRAGAQSNGARGVKVIDNPLISGVRSLTAHSSKDHTFLWGLSRGGKVFYSRCPLGEEGNPKAWSYPIPIEEGVEQLASLLNRRLQANEIFAHAAGQQLKRMTQDPLTTIWKDRSIVLPPLDVNDVVERTTYSTHLTLSDEDDLPLPGTSIWLSSTSPGNVYVNDLYTSLLPDAPVEVRSDGSANITIVQEVQTLGAVTYNLHGADGTVMNINPMKTVTERMAAVKSGKELGKIFITDENGGKRPLVPPSVSGKQRDAAAQHLQRLSEVVAKLPQNGSVAQPAKNEVPLGRIDLFRHRVWGMSFENGDVAYYEGATALEACGLTLLPSGLAVYRDASGAFSPIGDAVKAAAGDVYRWLRHAYNEVKHFFVKVVGDVYNFFIMIGNKWYHFLLTCISDVVHGLEFVFNKIKVFFKELAMWLGFIFQWQDIIRTHRVLKNLVGRYLEHAAGEIPRFRDQLESIFDGIGDKIDRWDGLEGTGGTIGGFTGRSSLAGRRSPQANWGVNQLKSNIRSASSDAGGSPVDSPELERLLRELLAALKREGAIFENAYATVEKDIVGELPRLSAGEVVKRLLAVLADVMVSSVENILVTVLDVLEILVEGVLGVLTAKIDIPVISWLYRTLTGEDLSLLDLACLVAAIPGTILYKALTGRTPFPDDAFTRAVIDAKSFEEIRELYASDAAGVAAGGVREALVQTLRLCAGIGATGFAAVSIFKAGDPTSGTISAVHGALFFLSTAPNLGALVLSSRQDWLLVAAEFIYGVTAIQKLADISTYKQAKFPVLKLWVEVSKVLDSVLGVIGLVPTIGALAKNQSTGSVVAFFSNVSWNFNRVLSLVADLKRTPRIFLVKIGLIEIYGLLVFVLAEGEPAAARPFPCFTTRWARSESVQCTRWRAIVAPG